MDTLLRRKPCGSGQRPLPDVPHMEIVLNPPPLHVRQGNHVRWRGARVRPTQQLAWAANLSHFVCQPGAPPEQACQRTSPDRLCLKATRTRSTLIPVYTEPQLKQNNISGTDTPLRTLACATLRKPPCRWQSCRKPHKPLPPNAPRDPIHLHQPHLHDLGCRDLAMATTRRHRESASG